MRDYTMDFTMEELEKMLSGISDDGKVSKEAEKAIRARIEEGKAKEFPLLEVRRQFRCKLSAEDGKKLGDVVEKFW